MCKYCEDLKIYKTIWEVGTDSNISISIIGCDLVVESEGISAMDNIQFAESINFCPFCGKALRPFFCDLVQKPCDYNNNNADAPMLICSWAKDDMMIALYIINDDKQRASLCLMLENVIPQNPVVTCMRPIAYCPVCGEILI